MKEFLPFFMILAMCTYSFFRMRHFLNGIIIYVMGKEDYKIEKKELTFVEHITYDVFCPILPKWVRVWYYAIICCIPVVIIMYIFCTVTSFNVVLIVIIASMMFFLTFSPMTFIFCKSKYYFGDTYDYSRIVDKYAIRRKIYPELYEDEGEDEEIEQ